MKSFLTLALALILPLTSLAGEILERGSNRKITFAIQNGEATFALVSGNETRELKRVKILAGDAESLTPEALGLDAYSKTRRITEGYEDVTDFLIEKLDMGIIFMPYISGPVYAGYTLSYLYTVPADWMSAEHRANRKTVRMIEGKSVKASEKVFNTLLEALSN